MMAINRKYRTCPTTGLQFHEPAEKLMRWNAVAAVVSLLVGGVLALLVLLTRWPAVHLLPADWFYLVLTAHGVDMLVFWIIFFEIAVMYFCSSTLLRCRLATPKMAWAGFWLMVLGALMNNYSVFRGDSSVMFTAYAPIRAHVPRLDSAGNVRRADCVHHRGVHYCRRRHHPDPDLPVVARADKPDRFVDVPHRFLGVRSLCTAGQRRGARLRVVRGRGHRVQRQAAVREGEPHRVFPLYPVSAARVRPPLARRPGHEFELEDLQHQLRDVSRGAGVDGAWAHRAGCDRSRA